jgi:branched-chain amino acid transport system permease protein
MGLDPYISLIIITPATFLFGLAVYKGLIKIVLEAPHRNQIVFTLGLSLALMGAFQVLWGAYFRNIHIELPLWSFFEIRVSGVRIAAFIVAVIFTAFLYFFLKRTDLGKAIRATAHDRKAAQLMGINIFTMYALAFGIGATSAGIAGGLLATFFYIGPTVGGIFGTIAYVVVVLGGLGSFPGAIIGGLILGLVESLSAVFIGIEWKEAVMFIVFMLILFLKPGGLMGTQAPEELVGKRV